MQCLLAYQAGLRTGCRLVDVGKHYRTWCSVPNPPRESRIRWNLEFCVQVPGIPWKAKGFIIFEFWVCCPPRMLRNVFRKTKLRKSSADLQNTWQSPVVLHWPMKKNPKLLLYLVRGSRGILKVLVLIFVFLDLENVLPWGLLKTFLHFAQNN